MSNQMPIYSQVVPKSQYKKNAKGGSRERPQNLARTDFDPLNYNHGGNFQLLNAPPEANKMEKDGKRESRRKEEIRRRAQNRTEASEGKVEAYLRQNQVSLRQQQHRHSAVRQAEHRVNLRSLPLNDVAPSRGHERTPTERHRAFPERDREGAREHRRERERDRERDNYDFDVKKIQHDDSENAKNHPRPWEMDDEENSNDYDADTDTTYVPPSTDVSSDESSTECNLLDKRIQESPLIHSTSNNSINSHLSYISNSPCRELISVSNKFIKPVNIERNISEKLCTNGDNGAPLLLLDEKLDGHRNRGKLKLRWLDGVVEDTEQVSSNKSSTEGNLLDKRIQESSLVHMTSNNSIDSDLSYISNSPCRELIAVSNEFIKPVNIEQNMKNISEELCTSTTKKPRPPKNKVVRGRDYCFYCENSVLNFARHLLRHHTYEVEVQEILSFQKKSVHRKNKITELRKKGNYIQNSVEVIKPMRKQKFTEYLPCANCLGFYSKKLLWKHSKKCSGKQRKNVQSEAQNLLLRNLKVDEKLKSTVFHRMRADKVSLVAKSDVLICAFASQYLKTHRENHCVNVVSRKMRELAKLLIEIKKNKPSVNNFFDALSPENYDEIVAATKVVGKFDTEKDRFDSPTFAMNISTSIKQCCHIAITMALKKQGPYTEVNTAEIEAGIKTLIQLIDSQWKFDISSQASTDLNKKKWNKVTIIPLANDLKILKEFLKKKAEEAANKIKEGSYNVETYIQLLETVYCRVLLLNRRRPGELQRIFVHDYLENHNDASNYEEFERALTASERILVKKFKRIVVRGKRGRGVPVLFNEDVQVDIKLLLSVRDRFVSSSNKLLFGNPGYESSIYGYKTLERYSKASGAKNPKAISSTRLRKHLATLSQIFSMSENDMEQLATFMGHTNDVHKKSYRLPDDVYQTAKISKLLILMEDGKADAFKGKTLDEINLDLNEELEGEIIENDEVLEFDLPEICQLSRKDCVQQEHNEQQPGTSGHQRKPEYCTEVSLPSEAEINAKKGKKRTLVPWTTEQKKVVTTFFKHHIKNKRPPKRNECENLKELHRDLLVNKDWLKIKVFVQNIYKKT